MSDTSIKDLISELSDANLAVARAAVAEHKAQMALIEAQNRFDKALHALGQRLRVAENPPTTDTREAREAA